MSNQPIWLYDGQCMLCSRAVQYVLRHGRNREIRFVAIGSDFGRQLAIEHGIDVNYPDTFLFISHGRSHAKSEGVFAVASESGGWFRLLLIGRIFPVRLCDAVYDWVARNRYRFFGHARACRLMDRQFAD